MPDRHTMSQRRRYTAAIKQAEIVAAEAKAEHDAAEKTERAALKEAWVRAEMQVASLCGAALFDYPVGSVVRLAMDRAMRSTYRWLAADDYKLFSLVADEERAAHLRKTEAARTAVAEVSG